MAAAALRRTRSDGLSSCASSVSTLATLRTRPSASAAAACTSVDGSCSSRFKRRWALFGSPIRPSATSVASRTSGRSSDEAFSITGSRSLRRKRPTAETASTATRVSGSAARRARVSAAAGDPASARSRMARTRSCVSPDWTSRIIRSSDGPRCRTRSTTARTAAAPSRTASRMVLPFTVRSPRPYKEMWPRPIPEGARASLRGRCPPAQGGPWHPSPLWRPGPVQSRTQLRTTTQPAPAHPAGPPAIWLTRRPRRARMLAAGGPSRGVRPRSTTWPRPG